IRHAGITVLDVHRVHLHDRAIVLEPHAQEQRFGPTVARSEGKVPQAIENGARTIDLKGLNDVRVVSDDEICATIDGQSRFRAISLGYLADIGDAPAMRDDDSINAGPQAGHVAGK